jgi:hypothetical protein
VKMQKREKRRHWERTGRRRQWGAERLGERKRLEDGGAKGGGK